MTNCIFGILALVAILVALIWFLKKLSKTDFNEFEAKHPYWLIKAFVFFLLFYPLLTELVAWCEQANPQNCCDVCLKTINASVQTDKNELKTPIYTFLTNYREYFATVISLMLASIAFIREDKSKKEEASKDREKLEKLEQEIKELKQNSINKKD